MIRTRIAPSPTGAPHIGTAYVALVNYCFAKKNGGSFILRIEDTDHVRSTADHEKSIMECLRWLGLDWDEGPDKGGDHGPYRQSERCDLYKTNANHLLEAGHAFKCFCSPETLAQMHEHQKQQALPLRYDGRCLDLSMADISRRERAGTPYVVRMKMPQSGTCIVSDGLRGPISVDWKQIDMQILIKSDGQATYHLASVVDDHMMGITDVIRGEEWIPSCPKHVLLYRYFGWDPPRFWHLPLLRNPDRSKLSKRKNQTGILFYRQFGYLPEALMNHIARLIVSSIGDHDFFTIQDVVEAFDVRKIGLSGPVFDTEKLDWLNGRYLRHKLSPQGLGVRYLEWVKDFGRLDEILAQSQSRIKRLSDIAPLAGFLFSGDLGLQVAALRGHGLTDAEVYAAFEVLLKDLEPLKDWHAGNLEEVMRRVASQLNIKLKTLLVVFYVALTGSSRSLPLFQAMEWLGRDMCNRRLRQARRLLEADN